jgi:hypothetical protein
MILESLFSSETATSVGIGTDKTFKTKGQSNQPTVGLSKDDNSSQIRSVAFLRLKRTGSSSSVVLGTIGIKTIDPSGCITGSFS